MLRQAVLSDAAFFPCEDVDVKVLEVRFQGVFEALALSSYLPCPLNKLTIQQLLGYSGV